MNWITNSVLPKIKAWVQSEDVPDNLWVKCRSCGQMIFHREFEEATIAVLPAAITRRYHQQTAFA
jgi:acetyl-CoA carboxylase beta subunit